MLAHKYGVTGKAIRDVWTHKTWACATRPFWAATYDSDGAVIYTTHVKRERSASAPAEPEPALKPARERVHLIDKLYDQVTAPNSSGNEASLAPPPNSL